MNECLCLDVPKNLERKLFIFHKCTTCTTLTLFFVSLPTLTHTHIHLVYTSYTLYISSNSTVRFPAHNVFWFHKPRSHIWSFLITNPLGHVNIAQLPLVVLPEVVVVVVVVVVPHFWTCFFLNPNRHVLCVKPRRQWIARDYPQFKYFSGKTSANICQHISNTTNIMSDVISIGFFFNGLSVQSKVSSSQRTPTRKKCHVCQLPVKEYNQHKINKKYHLVLYSEPFLFGGSKWPFLSAKMWQKWSLDLVPKGFQEAVGSANSFRHGVGSGSVSCFFSFHDSGSEPVVQNMCSEDFRSSHDFRCGSCSKGLSQGTGTWIMGI